MKKIIKRIITIIIALALFVGIGVLLRYLMFDDVESYSRLLFHDLHDQEENLDTLFVGSSHVRRSINPIVIDEITGLHSFNCGTADQRIDGSLAVIQDACSDNDIKHIYLDMYYFMMDSSFAERSGLTSTYLVSDYLPLSLNKIKYLLKAGDPKHYSNSFMVFRRNWEQIFDTAYISDLFEKKHEETYLNYEFGDWESAGDDYYVGKGYFANDYKAGKELKYNRYSYGPINNIEVISDQESDWRKTFQEIVEYCKDRNIELILYTTPEPEWTIVGKGNYQDYHDAVQTLAEENDLEFYDFNLVRPEYFDDNDMELFMDIDHLNTEGAGKFSTLLGELFTGKLSGENIFYSNMDEKIADAEPRVYGIARPWNGVSEEWPMFMISNRLGKIEYKITADSYTTGKTTLIQDFSDNIYFNVPIDESGKLTILWRVKGQADEHVFEAEY